MALIERSPAPVEQLVEPTDRARGFARVLGFLGIKRQTAASDIQEDRQTPEVPVSLETVARLEEVCEGVWAAVHATTPANKFPGYTVGRGVLDDGQTESVKISRAKTSGARHVDIKLFRRNTDDGTERWAVTKKTSRAGYEFEPSFSRFVTTLDYTVDPRTNATKTIEMIRPAHQDEVIADGSEEVTELQGLSVEDTLSESQASTLIHDLSYFVSPDTRAA